MFSEITHDNKAYVITPDNVFVEYDPRCRNCRFWNKYSDACTNPLNLHGKTVFDDGQRSDPQMFSVAIAPPDFGCVHFETKGLGPIGE